jgi:hypothetical protein
MPTLGTQNISTSYPQLLKTFGLGGLDGNLQVITDGDNTSSALSLSTTGVQSTGSLAVDGTSLLTGIVTFGTSLTASTGTATIGTLSVGTATISTATIPAITLSTATISTASISTATIPLQLGTVTFGSSITASTGTATIGTLVATSETVTNSTVSNRITSGTYRIGAAGPSITSMSYGTASFPSTVVGPYNASGTSTGTFAVTGAQLGDFVCGSINSIGSATGGAGFYCVPSFYVISADTIRWAIAGPATQGTIGAGIVSATAWRMTA